MNLLRLSQVHRPSRYGKRRWHHHQRHCHKMCSHLGLHHWDRMMHPKSEELVSSKVLSGGFKNSNPDREVTLVVIHIYFLVLHEVLFTLAYLLICISIAFRKRKIKSFMTALHHCIIKPKPMWKKNSQCIKAQGSIHCGGIKIYMYKYTMHTFSYI